MDNSIFNIELFGKLEKINETISKIRARIFYTQANRNGTYITEEFATKLMESIPYAPIKGIFEGDEKDFTDHGDKRDAGKIYGVVPQDYNFSWEDHEDQDGVIRTYACVDVYLYTSIYKEASTILDKSLSMELFRPSIKGAWKIIEGKKFYEYTDACFLGLQVLGDDVEPCFEGAGFFQLYNMIEKAYFQLQKYNIETGGETHMDMINFKLSDRVKYDLIWQLLNGEYYTEENDWSVRYCINDVYDDYAICYDYEEMSYCRAFYSKDDESDSLTLDKIEKCFIIDVNQEELDSLSRLRALNSDTYANIDKTYSNMTTSVETLNASLASLNMEKATLVFEKETLSGQNEQFSLQVEELTAQNTTKDESINTLNNKLADLQDFKDKYELAEKNKVIEKYSLTLSKDVLDTYSAKINDYSVIDLDKELSYELVSSKPEIFSLETSQVVIPTQTGTLSGVQELINKYKK